MNEYELILNVLNENKVTNMIAIKTKPIVTKFNSSKGGKIYKKYKWKKAVKADIKNIKFMKKRRIAQTKHKAKIKSNYEHQQLRKYLLLK
jgi:hypothetical protein